MMRCVVSTCEHDSITSLNQGVTFYLLPTEASLRDEWLKALDREDWKPQESWAVCSFHVLTQDQCLRKTGLRRLQVDNIPLIKMCRICLASGCKLYSMLDYKYLNRAYEELTGLTSEHNDNLPPYLCPECAQRLLNGARFRNRGLRSHLLLLEAIRKHDPITLETIKSVNGHQIISSSLSVTRRIDEYDLDIVHIKKENIAEETDTDTGVVSGDTFVSGENVNMIILEITNDAKNISRPYIPSLHEEKILEDVKMESDNIMKMESHNIVKMESDNDQVEKWNVSREPPVAIYIKTERDDISLDDGNISEDVNLSNSRDCFKGFHTSDSNTERHYDEYSNNTSYMKLEHATIGEGDSPELVLPCSGEKQTFSGEVQLMKTPRHRQTNHRAPRLKTVGFKLRNDHCHLVERLATTLTANKSRAKPATRAPRGHRATQPGEKPYSCKDCNKSFEHKSNLRKHLKIHLGVKPHSCDVCEKTFSIKSKLNRHSLTHSHVKRHFCKVCNRTFRVESNLLIHLRIHSGEKPYVCDVCGSAFKDKRDIRKHLKIHTGVKPYSCDICSKAFVIKNKLMRHLATHSDEKPYPCKVCKKAFREKSDLKKHSRKHGIKPYACNVCSKTFSYSSVLKKHLRLHSVEKALKCDICNKLFNRKCNLNKHLRIHSVETTKT